MKYFYFIIMYANIDYLRTLANLGLKKTMKNHDPEITQSFFH